MTSTIDKSYVSEIDKELAKFDQKNKPSPAQVAEIEKYKDIGNKRDNLQPAAKEKQSDLWDGF